MPRTSRKSTASTASTTVATNTVSLYVRLSKEAGTAQTGLASQEQDARALAASLGLTVIGVHTDDGESGDTRSREAYAAWIDDAREGRADHLIAYSIDRVNRGGIAALATFLDIVEGRNPDGTSAKRGPVRFLSSSDGLDSDASDWTIRVSVMAGLAKAERERMSTRSKRAHKQRKDAGRWSGGTVPVGLAVVDHPEGGKVLAVNPEESGRVREVIRIASTGGSLGQAARYLNANGPAPRRAGDWNRTTVGQWLLAASVQSLLMSDTERQAVNAALAGNLQTVQALAPRKPSRLLSGMLLCGTCGAPMHLTSNKDRNGDPRIMYRCSRGSRAAGCPSPVNITAGPLEDAVSAEWLAGWGTWAETKAVRLSDEHSDALARARESVDRLSGEVLKVRGAARTAALAVLEAAEEEVERLEAMPLSTLLILKETGRTYAQAWETGTVEDRRNMLLETVGKLTILPTVGNGSAGFLARVREPLTPGADEAVNA